jgi:hypothetical protein
MSISPATLAEADPGLNLYTVEMIISPATLAEVAPGLNLYS